MKGKKGNLYGKAVQTLMDGLTITKPLWMIESERKAAVVKQRMIEAGTEIREYERKHGLTNQEVRKLHNAGLLKAEIIDGRMYLYEVGPEEGDRA